MNSASADLPRRSVIAVIPARGGSSGVIQKNLRRVGGMSLIARAVDTARSARRIDQVLVSTDDLAIAQAARIAGAEVIERPQALATSEASSESALLHALDSLAEDPAILVFIQATSPFIDPEALDDAIERVQRDEADVVFSATRSHSFLWRDGTAGATGVNHDPSVRRRRQDLDPEYQETGAFYVIRVSSFRKSGARFCGRIGMAVVPQLSAIEIDTPEDLELAKAIAPMLDRREVIRVDAVVTDFDGVHTDDRVHVDVDGSELVTVSRSDGMGVEFLRNAGIALLILSKETNPVVAARAKKLKVEVLQAIEDKGTALTQWADRQGLDLARVAYLGNDVNDLVCMDLVGWPVAVADAHPAVRAAARVVLSKRGGHGAVRELADRVLTRSPSARQLQEEK